MRLFTYLWASPTTLLGLVFLPTVWIGRSAGMRVVDGVIELYSPAIRFFLCRCTLLKGGASAMTLGHVVLGCDPLVLDMTRSHERVHVRQCERWGPFFIPAYLGASAWALVCGRRAYRDNPFEREAYEST